MQIKKVIKYIFVLFVLKLFSLCKYFTLLKQKRKKCKIKSHNDIIQELSKHMLIFTDVVIYESSETIGILYDHIELFFSIIEVELSPYITVNTSHKLKINSYITNILIKNIKKSSSFTISHKKISLHVLIWDIGDDIYPQDISIKLMCRSPIALARTISNLDFKQGKLPENGIFPIPRLYKYHLGTRINFPVDVAYTWVNYDDCEWQKLIAQYNDINSINKCLYYNFNELKYSMRSLYMYAPWVRKIFVLTNCARPEWLDSYPAIEWIMHSDIFHQAHLPCFNSHVIASYIGNIPGLAEHFIYFNDDAFLGRSVQPNLFFKSNGCSISYMGSAFIRSKYHDNAKAYLKAAVNGKELLEKKYNLSFPLQHLHIPSAICKNALLDMLKEFNKEFFECRKNKFRSDSDISAIAYLYHNYAYIKKYTVFNELPYPQILIQARNFRHAPLYSNKYAFIGLNDGQDSITDTDFVNFKIRYMERNFPIIPPWEKQ